MNDYYKMNGRASLAARSRSIDFSDLSFSPPQSPKYPPRAAFNAQQDRAPAVDTHDPSQLHEEQGGGGERFGVILSRNCSSASQRFRARERNHHASSTLQAAVRRAFSMGKSSSVTEGYRRIHDTAVDDADGDCDADAAPKPQQPQQQQETRAPCRKKGGKIIIRACKRLFGF